MGLIATAKGLSDETEFNCGYITFGAYRMAVARAYNTEYGALYQKWYLNQGITEDECERLNEMDNEGLNIFLTHCDCDGKFTPQECRKIYNAMKGLKVDMQGHNYGVMKPYDMHKHWLDMFLHCAKRRVNLYFH